MYALAFDELFCFGPDVGFAGHKELLSQRRHWCGRLMGLLLRVESLGFGASHVSFEI